MRWTKEQYAEYQARRSNAGARSVIQEYQDGNRGEERPATKADNKPKDEKVDGQLPRRFSVSVVAFVSDNRRRDLDGMCSTLLDCLIAARRLLAERAGIERPSGRGKQGG